MTMNTFKVITDFQTYEVEANTFTFETDSGSYQFIADDLVVASFPEPAVRSIFRKNNVDQVDFDAGGYDGLFPYSDMMSVSSRENKKEIEKLKRKLDNIDECNC